MLKEGVIRALGTMSGTSLDGVDAAVIETDGVRVFEFGESAYRPYSSDEESVLRQALGRWPGEAGVDAAAEVVETAHAALLWDFEAVDLIGFHGQTLAHEPLGRGTHQAGDGTILAEVLQHKLSAPVVWDFRTSDVALGGQGAPLAPAYHFALVQYLGITEPVAFLNLGGVGNLTFADPRKSGMEKPGALLAFDTGPANAPINDLVKTRLGKPFDTDGELARLGKVSEDILATFSAERFFSRMPPKSLDRNDFPRLSEAVASLSVEDAAATLTACAAAAVVLGAEHLPEKPSRVLVTGGGRRNPVLMEMIQSGFECPVEPVEAHGLDGDMLEAQAFAFLAVRVARGLPTSFPGTTGVSAAVGGGQIAQAEVGMSNPGSANSNPSN